jgi:hypothetical protein
MAGRLRSTAVPFSRRTFLRGTVAGSALLLLRRPAARAFTATQTTGFLGSDELRLVDAVTSRIIPSDDTIGAHEAGVVNYIQGLLSAFPAADTNRDGRRGAADLISILSAFGSNDPAADVDRDGTVTEADVHLATTALYNGRPIFAGGPFSGRNPFGDPTTGAPSGRFPRNSFVDYVELPRVKRLAWTVRLDGASAVPEVADNPLAISLADVDLRRKYREGLPLFDQVAEEIHSARFVDLTEEQQDEVLAEVQQRNRSFMTLLTFHSIEGLLCAPEYGGNRDGLGWALVQFDGDSQPLGYTIFDETAQEYRERADKPNSRPNPDEDCSGLSEEMVEFLRVALVTLAGAKEFEAPFCFSPDE